MDSETDRLNDYWNSRNYTRNNEFAEYFFRQGARMHKLLDTICDFQIPNAFTLEQDRPLIFAANHRSFLDILVGGALFTHLGLSCRFQVQARMFNRPFIGPWLRKLGCIPTNRSVRQQAEETSLATLRAGHTIAIMPEGRLVPESDRPGGVSSGRPGLSRIARQTDALVIPVSCHGTDRVWPRGRPFPKSGLFSKQLVSIDVGAPIEFATNDHKENVKVVMSEIAGMLAIRDSEQGLS